MTDESALEGWKTFSGFFQCMVLSTINHTAMNVIGMKKETKSCHREVIIDHIRRRTKIEGGAGGWVPYSTGAFVRKLVVVHACHVQT